MIKESLVLVTLDADGSHKPYIFRCPKYTLHVEDKVIVETCKGEVNGKVVGVLDYVTDEALNFINTLNTGRTIKKVLKLVKELEIEYDE
jgi:hypothetical protein